jgi:hypothetical protein
MGTFMGNYEQAPSHASDPPPSVQQSLAPPISSAPTTSLLSLPATTETRKEVVPAPKAIPPVFGTPTKVSIPSIGITDASVGSLGSVPGDQCGQAREVRCLNPVSDQIVWYQDSVQPGQPGYALLLGHDYTRAGNTPFWYLYRVPVGEIITLQVSNTNTNGQLSTLSLKVVSNEMILKTDVMNDPRIRDTHSTTNKIVVFVTCNPDKGIVNGHALYNQIVTTEVISAS